MYGRSQLEETSAFFNDLCIRISPLHYEEMGKFLRKIRNESVCIIEKFKLSYLYTSILL